MDESSWKNEGVARLKLLSEKAVRGVYKAHKKNTLKTNGNFRGTWVGVGWNKPVTDMSIRAIVRPMVLIPGKFARLVSVTLKPNGLALVSPGLARAEVVK